MLALLFACCLMLQLSLPYIGGRYDIDFLLTKQSIIHIKHWRYAFYFHVAFSILTLAAGFTQFSSFLQKKYRKLHRAVGYIYVVDVLFVSGPSGLIMSFYANGTLAAKSSFVILSLLWIGFTLLAAYFARKKNFPVHKNWMMRSYALTLSAISLRFYAWLLPRFLHLDGVSEYTFIAWISWTINLLVAELLILRNMYAQSRSTNSA